VTPGRWLLVFLAVLSLYFVTRFPETPYNEPVLQADALLHGHAAIDGAAAHIEKLHYQGHLYALHPPGAALMLMPFVAIWGTQTPQTKIAIVLGAANIALCYLLLCRFEVEERMRLWYVAFIAFGTVAWYEAARGATWNMPIAFSIFWSLLALRELYGPIRPSRLGAYLAAGCLCRYDLALAVPFLLAIAWLRGRTVRELLWIAPPFLAVGVFFVAFNMVRYHSWFDVGISLCEISPGGHVFGWQWLPQNVNTIFCLAPLINTVWPYVHPQPAGQSVLLTSPAFVLAFDARPSKETVLLWLAALGVALPSLFCWGNGWAQFGGRHYIQCYPFLLVLMAAGTGELSRMARVLILISVAMCGYGVWYLHIYPDFWGGGTGFH
jgi:hypothetical protein